MEELLGEGSKNGLISSYQDTTPSKASLIGEELLKFYLDIQNYILSPKTHPNPLLPLKEIKDVVFDVSNLKYQKTTLQDEIALSEASTNPSEQNSQNSEKIKKSKEVFCTISHFSTHFESLISYLTILKELLLSNSQNTLIKKRELFYKTIDHFENQKQTDYYIQRLAFILEIPRNLLNIVSILLQLFDYTPYTPLQQTLIILRDRQLKDLQQETL